MIFVEIDKDTWIAKHNLETSEYHCPKCGNTYQTTLPFVTSDCVGLASPVHECGQGYVGYVLTPKNNKTQNFWRSILS